MPRRLLPAGLGARVARVVLAAAIGLLPIVTPSRAHAHEIPRHVAVRGWVEADGHQLRVLLRVPLESMRDVEFPVRGAGFLDLARADAATRDAARLWIADYVRAFENGTPLSPPRITAARTSLPSDGMFARLDLARAHMNEPPLADAIDIPWQQAMLDVALVFDVSSDQSRFSILPALARLGVRTSSVVTFVRPDGAERVFTYEGDPGVIDLDPSALGAATRFVGLGIEHILGGIDHLLFLLLLVLPFRQLRSVIALATSFTLAHSITLGASALGYAPGALWFPPLVETLIALSIVFMACENILGAKLERRWQMAFAFGLIHGFGFSFALRDTLQFAGSHLVASLAAFNVGVELGQLAVLAVAVPALVWLLRRTPERATVILLSAIVAHTGWHWMTERAGELAQYSFARPTFDVEFAIVAIRLAMVLLIAGGTLWLLHGTLRRFIAKPSRSAAALALIAAAVAVVAPAPSRAQGARRATRSTMSGVYSTEQAKAGRDVFTGFCSGCHTPQSHTGVVFTSKWIGRSLEEYYSYIRNSMPKTAPGTLEETEYAAVTAYLLKLNNMPAGKSELPADVAVLKGMRIDTAAVGGSSNEDDERTAHYTVQHHIQRH